MDSGPGAAPHFLHGLHQPGSGEGPNPVRSPGNRGFAGPWPSALHAPAPSQPQPSPRMRPGRRGGRTWNMG